MAGITGNMDLFNSAEVYGRVLAELADSDPSIVACAADVAKSTKIGQFRDLHPDRFFNVGIAEQDLIGIAAGLALSGKKPYATTFAAFASLRALDQIHTDICYPNLNVKIVASHGGTMASGGPTHNAVEDIAIMRAIANMTMVIPGDPTEMEKTIRASVVTPGPMYIRCGRGFEPVVYHEDYDFQIGKGVTTREGTDVTVITCGTCLAACVNVADKLKGEISVRVIDMHTLKPLDEEIILKAARETGCIVTVEDHNTIGGLGSAVADVLGSNQTVARVKKLGIPNVFTCPGTPEQIHDFYGYGEAGIEEAVKEILK